MSGRSEGKEGKRAQEGKRRRQEGPAGEEGTPRDRLQDGLDALSGMKDRLEKALDEARARGDLDPEKAGELAREAGKRLRGAADRAGRKVRETDREDLEKAVADLKQRMNRVEEGLRERWSGGKGGGGKSGEGARNREGDP